MRHGFEHKAGQWLVFPVLLAVVLLSSMASAQTLTPAQIRAAQRLFESSDSGNFAGLRPEDLAAKANNETAMLPESDDSKEDSSEDSEALAELRLENGDFLVVNFSIREDLVAIDNPLAEQNRERIESDDFLTRILGRRSFKLTEQGALEILGLEAMYLSGLNAEEAAVRIGADSYLQELDVTVTILPLAPQGRAALEPFGHALFGDESSPMLTTPMSLPVPADYVIGPGDTVNIALFGNTNADFALVVDRDGAIHLPEIGPINVAGMTFSDLRDGVTKHVQEKMIGTRVNVTMGPLSSIQVYVLGEVNNPGSITVGSLSTVTNALFESGGISDIGSLRRIQHKRNGNLLQTVDLYDLLLRGDTSGNTRLLPGDVIFVPVIEKQVAIDGAVMRPALYELRGETSVSQVLALAGGAIPTADTSAIRILRIDESQERIVVGVDLRDAFEAKTAIAAGDFLNVPSVPDSAIQYVFIEGSVARPGEYAWFPALRISHLFPSRDLLLPRADLNYVLIRRQPSPDAQVEYVSADLDQALRSPGTLSDVALEPRDRLLIFDLQSDRNRMLQPLLDEIQMNASSGNPAKEVRVGGLVKFPGTYPLESAMTVGDLIRAGGGLGESAYAIQAELARYVVQDGAIRVAELIPVDLESVVNGNSLSDIPLKSYDYLTIKMVTDWGSQEQVMLEGEFKFPGIYQIRKGETLSSVVERAGGFTKLAFPRGAVFTRVSLQEREQKQLDQLARRLEAELTTTAMIRIQDAPSASQAVALGQTLVEQLKEARAVGRLVINIEEVMANPGSNDYDIELQDGDVLSVPMRSQEVTVIGEIQYPTSHIYAPGLSRTDYIADSGGLTVNADKKRIYVVKASGAVVATPSSGWFKSGEKVKIEPGDTIVVPLDADRVSKLSLVTSVSSVIFQLGVLAAAATN